MAKSKSNTSRYSHLPAREDIRRILIIKWSALGDIATASAIFQDVRDAFPDALIDLNTLPSYRSLFAHDKRFNQVIAVDVRDRKHRWRCLWDWVSAIKPGKYDLVVDLQTNDRSRLLLVLLALTGGRIPYRLGTSRLFPYNIKPRQNLKNTFRRYQNAIQSGGIAANNPRAVMYYRDENIANINKLARQYNFYNKSYAILMPGSSAGGELKRWGSENYAALGQILHQAGVEKIILVGAQDEQEECSRIEALCSDWLINLCNQTSVLDLIPLCEGATYIVTNDTGTGRIGAASKTPMVMIFGPTDRERDIPGNPELEALQVSSEELDCVKCFRKQCSHHSCMKMITPEQVFMVLKSIEAREQNNARAEPRDNND